MCQNLMETIENGSASAEKPAAAGPEVSAEDELSCSVRQQSAAKLKVTNLNWMPGKIDRAQPNRPKIETM